MKGGVGNDTLEGGKGNDALFGGSGVDSFVIKGTSLGHDIVLGLERGVDVVRLIG